MGVSFSMTWTLAMDFGQRWFGPRAQLEYVSERALRDSEKRIATMRVWNHWYWSAAEKVERQRFEVQRPHLQDFKRTESTWRGKACRGLHYSLSFVSWTPLPPCLSASVFWNSTAIARRLTEIAGSIHTCPLYPEAQGEARLERPRL